MSDHIPDTNKMVDDYRQKAIEDGEHIYTLSLRSERYRGALMSALEENAHLHDIIERASAAFFAWGGDEQNCAKMLKILNEARPTNPIPKP
jgi:hypothetical protein